MTLDQLRYFCAVCQYDSVTQAAQVLNVSQPSVSSAIRNLEEEFGVLLFDRQRKRLRLTPAGNQLLALSRPLLADAEELKQTMQSVKERQLLRLGVPPMIGSLILQKLYSEFVPCNPQVHLQILEDGSGYLRRLLAEGKIHMAFLPHTSDLDRSLDCVELIRLQNVCCVSRDHPLAGKEKISLSQLADEPLVLFKNSFFQTERILTGFGQLGCQPNVLLYTAQPATVQNMIRENAAVGFMFRFLGDQTKDIVGIPLEPEMTTRVSLVWRRERQFSDAMRAVVRFVEQVTFEESLCGGAPCTTN